MALYYYNNIILLYYVILLVLVSVGVVANTDSALSMAEGEHLTVMEADQGDGWTHVKNANGDSGFVPTAYVQFHYRS